MSTKEEICTHRKNGKVYVVKTKTNKPSGLTGVLRALTTYIAMLAVLYGVLSFNRPDLIVLVLENKIALSALLFGFGVVVVALTVNMAGLGRATFEKVKNLEGRTKDNSLLFVLVEWVLGATFGVELAPLDESDSKSSKVDSKEDFFSYGAFSSDTPFEAHTSNILKSLSTYATSSEVTATKLLDKGVAFMAGGLVFYVGAIILWQVFANLIRPDPNVMYVGMAACSITFIVIEFLAAWFFKQYRYYVEVSLSCLRVRSVYDRYLLSYYSLREFKGESDESIRKQMAEVIKEDVNWPSYKGSVANDFNYMVESMGAAHTSMEKVKDIFQPKKKTKSKAEKS